MRGFYCKIKTVIRCWNYYCLTCIPCRYNIINNGSLRLFRYYTDRLFIDRLFNCLVLSELYVKIDYSNTIAYNLIISTDDDTLKSIKVPSGTSEP